MKLCTAVQEGCGYKDTLCAHRYSAPSAKYFAVCIIYQPPLVFILHRSARCFRYFTSEERSSGALNRRLSGPQNWYEYFGEQKNFASTRNQNIKLFIFVVCTLTFPKGNYLLHFSHRYFISNTVQCTSQYFWQI